jgi:hypothetical protein
MTAPRPGTAAEIQTTMIGTFRVVGHQRLIIADTVDVWAVLPIPDEDPVRLRLKFLTDETSTDTQLGLKGQNDHAVLTFTNWKNAGGLATPKPLHIATSEKGRQLYVLAAMFLLGEIRLLDLQMMVAGEK